MQLTQAERQAIEQLVRETEASVAVQLVASVVERADAYPELPWRVFGLGLSLSAGLCFLLAMQPGWAPAWRMPELLAALLAGGLLLTLLVLALPPLARLLLPAWRRRQELRQYAQAQFLERAWFDTPQRNALLLCVGLFEREAVIVADPSLRERLGAALLAQSSDAMRERLRQADLAGAFAAAIAVLRPRLAEATQAHADAIAVRVVHERGQP